jgi:nucleoside-diphosphate-sugar epimerase
MKVFVVGATGAIGRPLVRALLHNGHQVVATTRRPEQARALREVGAQPMVVDVLDRAAIVDAVVRSSPDAVAHQATALGGRFDLKHFDRFFEPTNRLRTSGTDHLIEAARAGGARRFVAQSYAGWPFESSGSDPNTEESPFEVNLPVEMRATADAIRRLETTVIGAEDLAGSVLRYGSFYGPGTSLGEGGEIVQAVRRRLMPIVGDGTGVWSFIHVDDAAVATVAALEHGAAGVFNVVDDEPAPLAEFLPELARILGAKPPRRVPEWLANLLIGDAGVYLMTAAPGASNAKAKRDLAWSPVYRSWRHGFRDGFGTERAASA